MRKHMKMGREAAKKIVEERILGRWDLERKEWAPHVGGRWGRPGLGCGERGEGSEGLR